ncbi:MAG: O-acetyl-ADP-ribose deacetylase [Spirochaetia bacterium]
MKELLEGALIVKEGDITREKVDVIVNAANSSLLGGGGVDGAIHKMGGKQILQECKEIRENQYPGGLPVGKAVITTAGKLPAKHVIHTVGPVWHGGNENERVKLANAYRNSLELAANTGLTTIAFPAISTGIYGFPKEIAAPIVFQTIKDHVNANTLPNKVMLVFFLKKDMNIFLESI